MLSPLSNPGFSMLWVANTLSLTAFWMTEVACAWQMRVMTDADPLAVAAVYTALQLPIMFLVIPAGVIADLSDRRRGMMWTHAWLAFSMGILLWLTWAGRITPTTRWLFCLNSIMVAAQMQLEPAIRGRGLSFIYTLGTASLAGGGLIWGAVARGASPAVALLAAGASLLLALAAAYRLNIVGSENALASSGLEGFQVGDDRVAVLFLGKANEAHGGAWDQVGGTKQPDIEIFLVPDEVLLLQGVGIQRVLEDCRPTLEDAGQVGSDLAALDFLGRVAGPAEDIEPLAARDQPGVRRRSRRGFPGRRRIVGSERGRQDRETKEQDRAQYARAERVFFHCCFHAR